jgi:hypothetical protein
MNTERAILEALLTLAVACRDELSAIIYNCVQSATDYPQKNQP